MRGRFVPDTHPKSRRWTVIASGLLCGLLALVDPVITKPTWTAVVFEHQGMAEAMKSLFEDYWRRAASSTNPGAGKA